MPNWCQNTMQVSGPADDVKRFRRTAKGHQQNYNEFSPTKGSWEAFDDIRLKSITTSLPEAGDIIDLSFHALFPVPEDFRRFPYDDSRARELGELVGCVRPYGGYTWESTHWGVKWGACNSQLEESGSNYLSYRFETPWGPPGEWLTKVAQDWPNLRFELSFEEPGMGFRGEMVFDEGNLELEYTTEYDEGEDDE